MSAPTSSNTAGIDNTQPTNTAAPQPDASVAASTSAHPPAHKPDPTLVDHHNAPQRGLSSTGASAAAKLSSAQVRLRNALRQFPDFPSPGILFEDILPIFADPATHEDLISALQLHVETSYSEKPDVIVGLDARGFLFGPSLALRLGAGFVPVRKQDKLPGPCETASYEKEYGQDFFQMQADAIKPGQKVLVVDDIIATGGSAAAAGSLVKKLGGTLIGYAFLLELDFLKGRAKLDAPVYTLLTGQEEKSS